MTDQPPSLSDDELDLAASLAIDGHDITDLLGQRPLTADDRREIDARVAQLRPAVDAVAAAVPTPSRDVRAAHLEAAVAAADRSATGTAAASDASAGATPLPARSRRRSRARTLAPWAVAAVVAAVIALAFSALAGQKHEKFAATSAASGGTTTAAPTTTAPLGTKPQYNAAEGKTVTATGDLGAVADADALVGRVRDSLRSASLSTAGTEPTGAQSATTTTAASEALVPACASTFATLRPPVGMVVFDASAVLGTTPVHVFVYVPAGTGSATRTLVAIDPATCQVLVDRPL